MNFLNSESMRILASEFGWTRDLVAADATYKNKKGEVVLVHNFSGGLEWVHSDVVLHMLVRLLDDDWTIKRHEISKLDIKITSKHIDEAILLAMYLELIL